MKKQESVNSLKQQAAEKLKELFGQVAFVELDGIRSEFGFGSPGIHFPVCLRAFGRPRTLICELTPNGQPRHVRNALLQLRDRVAENESSAVPIIIAPYLSSDSQALCRARGIGFLDLQGNAFIAFDSIHIERLVGGAPPAEKRKLKSLFAPKAARVLLVMLRDPERKWRVAELAEASDVSLGHASGIRAALLDREWARLDSKGMSLAKPSDLLDAWRDEYEMPTEKTFRYYTPLHGREFEDAVREALRSESGKANALLALYSASNWLAPYARTRTDFFYADAIGLERLKGKLRLSSAAKGENVVIALPKDEWVLSDIVEPAPGFVCTSPLRTYLDLATAGEHGREAAAHLRRMKLNWQK